VRRITLLALPIIGAMVSQNILNLVDTAMVSRLSESNIALAAVGFGGFILFFSQALLLGLSTGVQASASRKKGQGENDTTAHCLNAALIVILISSPFLTLGLIWLAPKFFPTLSGDPSIAELGIPYLQIRALGIIFVAANFAFRGYWNAVDMTWLYLKSLVSMHAVNIFLNYVLIFGNFGAPKLGVDGAAIASVVAIGFGTLTYFILGFKHARQYGFLDTLPRANEIKQLIKLSLPNGVQQMFFAAGFIVMFWIIGKMGVAEVAAANVLINMWLITLLPGMGMGLAAATLIGQALGKGNPEDAVEWGWDVSKVALFGMLLIGLPFVAMPEIILTSMYKLTPETLDLAIWPMRLIGISTVYEAVGVVLQGALLGAGDTRRVMRVVVLGQWVIFLPIAYLIGPILGYGLTAIWVAQTIYRIMQTGIWVSFWVGRKWAQIRL
jgi:MATE family multidrug resistance protein